MFDGKTVTSPIYDIASAILSLLVMIVGWDNKTINSILNPLKEDIYHGLTNINTTMKNIVDNKFPPLLAKHFGPDNTPDDVKETKRFIQKLMPYLILLATFTMYLYRNETDINNDEKNSYANLEFVNFKLLKLKLDINNELDGYTFIEFKEKNMEAINKIIYTVNLMSDSI